MTLAILGTGSVGSALGPRFAAVGHTVVYGSRQSDRDDVRALVARTGPEASAALPADAVAETDVVVLATPWEATEALVRSLDLAWKVVLDTTNPLSFPDLGLLVETSAGELIQSWAPDARVVKAFSSVGASVMADAAFPMGVRPVMFVAGDEGEARATAIELAEALGFEGVDAGGIVRSRALEQLAVLWIAQSGAEGREHALGMLRR